MQKFWKNFFRKMVQYCLVGPITFRSIKFNISISSKFDFLVYTRLMVHPLNVNFVTANQIHGARLSWYLTAPGYYFNQTNRLVGSVNENLDYFVNKNHMIHGRSKVFFSQMSMKITTKKQIGFKLRFRQI